MTNYEEVKSFVYKYFRENSQLATPATNTLSTLDRVPPEGSVYFEKKLTEAKCWDDIKHAVDGFQGWADEPTIYLLEALLDEFAGISVSKLEEKDG